MPSPLPADAIHKEKKTKKKKKKRGTAREREREEEKGRGDVEATKNPSHIFQSKVPWKCTKEETRATERGQATLEGNISHCQILKPSTRWLDNFKQMKESYHNFKGTKESYHDFKRIKES